MNATNRIPKSECKDRRLYYIDARHLYFGVFCAKTGGFLGLRDKFGELFVFQEFHWDNGAPHGTATPIEDSQMDLPPSIDLNAERTNAALFWWLFEQEQQRLADVAKKYSDESNELAFKIRQQRIASEIAHAKFLRESGPGKKVVLTSEFAHGVSNRLVTQLVSRGYRVLTFENISDSHSPLPKLGVVFIDPENARDAAVYRCLFPAESRETRPWICAVCRNYDSSADKAWDQQLLLEDVVKSADSVAESHC